MFKKLNKIQKELHERLSDINDTLERRNLNAKLNIVILESSDKKLKKKIKEDDKS